MRTLPLGVAAAAVVAVGGAQAHHSGAMYAADKVINLDGTVRLFQWTNPHSWVQVVTTKDGGGTEEWSVELAGPGVLTHRGWKPTTLKPGDKVVVTIHPLRDGGRAGSFVSATLADGTVINTGNGSGGARPAAN